MPALREFHLTWMGEVVRQGLQARRFPLERYPCRMLTTETSQPTRRTNWWKPAKKNHCGFVACGRDGWMSTAHDTSRSAKRKSPRFPSSTAETTSKARAAIAANYLARNGASSRDRADWGRTQGESVRGTGSVGGGGGVLDSRWGCALMVEVYRPQTGDASPPLSKQDGALVEWRWVLGGRPPPR